MSKKKLTPKYYDNKSVKDKIDKLLKQNARNVANLGTNSVLDLGSNDKVEEEWIKILDRIKELDPIFYDIVKKHTR